MYSEKLPVVFLSTIASEHDGSTNCQIANYILEHLEEVSRMSLSELARSCFVANSSVSRFCREIGLEDFMELKEILQDSPNGIPLYSEKEKASERALEFYKYSQAAMELVIRSVDYRGIEALVQDLERYDRVSLFGMLKAETAAMNLQNDLLILGKRTNTKVSFGQQQEYFKDLTEEQLFVIFSYTGVYFDYGFRQQIIESGRKAKIYMITSDPEAKKNRCYDRVITFKSLQDYASHPFQLQLIASLIAQEYGRSRRSKRLPLHENPCHS